MANSAMLVAPAAGPPLRAATSNAEYSSPQGIKAQAMPMVKMPPRLVASGLTRDHTERPAWSAHTGGRANTTSIKPQASTATCSKVHRGRSMTNWLLIHARLCIAVAAAAPASA